MTLSGFSVRTFITKGALCVVWAACMLPALANAWTRMGETPEVTLYVDRQSIEKEDNIRRVWELQDLKVADADGVMSRRYLNEYDCQYKMHRLSKVTSHAGPKLTGKKLFTVNETGYWRKIPPNGIFVLTYVAVCIQ